MTPEFSRLERLDRIGAGASSVEISADARERAALAKRFGLEAIDRLDASYALRRDAAGVRATGHLSARVSYRHAPESICQLPVESFLDATLSRQSKPALRLRHSPSHPRSLPPGRSSDRRS